MRRILSALLLALITAIGPLAPPVSAEGVSPLPKPGATPPGATAHHPRHGAHPHLDSRQVIDAATQRYLAVTARAMRVTVGELRAQWQHVAICEVGGNWAMVGSAYSGIGFLNTTWSQYGGMRYAPLAGLATRDQQIVIGMKVTHGWVPDQFGCSRNGW